MLPPQHRRMDTDTIFEACAHDHRGFVTRAQLAAAGLGRGPLQRALAGQALVRVRRTVYARQPLAPWGEHLLSGGQVDAVYLQHAQAALLALGPNAALTGRTAAVLWGLDMLVEPAALELQLGRGHSHVDLLDVDARRTSYDVQTVSGLRVLTLPATLQDVARTRPLAETVAIIDTALRRRLIKPAQLRGGGRLAHAIALADPRAESVLESALRVLLRQAGLPRPQTQRVVRSGDAFVARVDFCWPSFRLIVETDGRRWHDPTDARDLDRRRDNACAVMGWRVLRFTWAEVLHDPEYVVATVRAALARRKAL
jgi:very-short-patch-repair endonuclease